MSVTAPTLHTHAHHDHAHHSHAAFVPLDVSAIANAGPSLPPDDGQWAHKGFPVGHKHFWGVPFDLPDPALHAGRCWAALSDRPAGRVRKQVTLTLPEPALAGGLSVAHCTD